MERLIIPLIIFIVISQIIKAMRKAVEEARKQAQNLPKIDPTIQLDLDFLESIKKEKNQAEKEDNRPRLIMQAEQRPKPKPLSLEQPSYIAQIFDEETHGSAYNMIADKPKTEEVPKPKAKPQTPVISFTPKNIAQGIVLSEILKRPKY